MRHVGREHAAQPAHTDDQQMVETRLAHRADPAFGMCMRRRCPEGHAHDIDALSREDGVAGRQERGVAIVDEIPGRCVCW
jgi:hypothetical protein